MNTAISDPRTTFLLGAGLDVLHQESREWLETTSFWEDEMKFIDKLLHRSEPLNQDLKAHKEMMESLHHLHDDFLNQLIEDVIEQEQLLARLERKEKGLADWDYRELHGRLHRRMDIMRKDFRLFKKVLFGYVKSL
ncbi:MAG: hypothetical protein DRI69_06900 [Bacteroidetes bacterium]|nr:MAG: hypothetical protein DRI69_06900 [Bacteroidota bacterium]